MTNMTEKKITFQRKEDRYLQLKKICPNKYMYLAEIDNQWKSKVRTYFSTCEHKKEHRLVYK